MKLGNKTQITLGLIILLGFILRVATLFKYGNFWDDEMFNFIYSQKAWPQGLVYWLWETNPPLHMLILKIWFLVFPANELFARLPSVLAGCAAIYFIYKLGKEMFAEKIGLLAAFYLAIHPYNIFWSATARIYSFLMLFTIVSTLILYRQFFLNDTTRLTKLSGAITNGLLIFSHLSSLFFLAGQFFALAIFKGKTAVWQWIKYNIAPFIFGGGWIVLSLYIKRNNHLDQAWFLNLSHNLKEDLDPLLNILVGQFWIISGLVLIILAFLLIVYTLYKTKSSNLLLLTTLVSFPIMLALALGVWHIKFIIGVLPLLVLALAYCLANTYKYIFSTLLITAICLIGLTNLWHTLPITDWNQIETPFKTYEKNDKFLFVYNHYVLKQQIDRYFPASIAQNAKTLILYKNMSWDDMVVQKNYIPVKLSDAEKNQWYTENKLDNYSTVALLQNEAPSVTRLDDLFAAHGWKLKQPPIRAQIVGTYRIYIYTKIEVQKSI